MSGTREGGPKRPLSAQGVRAGGVHDPPVARTALMVLIDQLELLRSSMDSMLDAAVHADAQALIAQGRFLDAKFGRVTPTVPDTAPAPPPAASSSSNTLDLG